ncbi:hypothetical protein F2Q70_00035788 [Brassica cretica]|uniref:Uncharacterized protein n=2 Tax=Brassica cretica TaxID=69181 RepID=A0A8S9G351_BRACR|nr:hypothetical protein F2Q68_00020660 [Brassica cretica]KAF2584773.1 hypothetical protein F2Q70_00035788 [Brassica cretica]KAF3563525.1 hypothetical protein DY000_02014519 [Brassica cretica]
MFIVLGETHGIILFVGHLWMLGLPRTWRFHKDQKVVEEPGGCIKTRRSSGNPEVFLDPEIIFGTRRSQGNPEVAGEPGGILRSYRELRGSSLDHGITFRTRRLYGNPKILP